MARKELRRAACMREAYALAATGSHADYLTIEKVLSGHYPEARSWLDSGSIRDDLRRVCDQARKGNSGAQRP